jgi:hypothetical protein
MAPQVKFSVYGALRGGDKDRSDADGTKGDFDMNAAHGN